MNLLLNLCVLSFGWVFSNIEAHNHLLRMIKDGKKDSLKRDFHLWAFLFRLGVIFLAILFFGFIYWLETGAVNYFLAYNTFVYSFAVFGYDFTRRLNRIRKEAGLVANIPTWYVSRDKDAAWTDRTLVKLASLLPKTTPEKVAEFVYIFGLAIAIGAGYSILKTNYILGFLITYFSN